MNAQVTFLEKEIAERNDKIKILTEKMADMHKNDFMVNEQLASLRRDYELATKRLADYELRKNKRLGVKGSTEDQEPNSDSRDGRPSSGRAALNSIGRPGSRGNPLAPIRETRLIVAKSKYYMCDV